LSRPASEVKGSAEFYKSYRNLKPGSPEKKMADSGLDKLKQNMTEDACVESLGILNGV